MNVINGSRRHCCNDWNLIWRIDENWICIQDLSCFFVRKLRMTRRRANTKFLTNLELLNWWIICKFFKFGWCDFENRPMTRWFLCGICLCKFTPTISVSACNHNVLANYPSDVMKRDANSAKSSTNVLMHLTTCSFQIETSKKWQRLAWFVCLTRKKCCNQEDSEACHEVVESERPHYWFKRYGNELWIRNLHKSFEKTALNNQALNAETKKRSQNAKMNHFEGYERHV